MFPRRRLLFASLLVLLLGLGVFCLSPIGVAGSVRGWLWWQARRQGLKIEIGKINAPWLRPVVIARLYAVSAANTPGQIDFLAEQAIVDLRLGNILTGASGHAIRSLRLGSLRVETHCETDIKGKSKLAWATLQKLLPDNLNIAKLDLRIEDGSTIVLLRNAALSAGQIEASRFNIGELQINSPLFRQTFSDLHGATGWHDNQLTLGGFTLTRGLVVQSMTTDLSRLANQRVGIEFDVDAFGGKLRSSTIHEWRGQQSNWNIAASATEISPAHTSEAFGFTNRIGGLLHAGKFTFRGDVRELSQATASIWLELTDSSWAGRTSNVIMLGAALYNRQIQLQQFYVKQRDNQLTLSGEGALPSNSSDWLSPDFRGDISGSIRDLGNFAGLFGAEPGDFGGAIDVVGTMNARERKIPGHLEDHGAAPTLFKTTIDTLDAKGNLKGMELEVEHLELKRKRDSLKLQGKIDTAHEHNYSGALSIAVQNLGDYSSILHPGTAKPKPVPAEVEATIDSTRWNAHGRIILPGSSPLDFTANFPLPVGADWNAFLASSVSFTVEFPSIFLTNAPQIFHAPIFHDGILSGKLSLSETLQHPRLAGDIQLTNGKLQSAYLNLTDMSGRLTFNGDHGSIDFFNAATKDVDLSLRGGIDLSDTTYLALT